MLTKFMLLRHQTLTLYQTHFPKFLLSSPPLASLLHTTTTVSYPSSAVAAAALRPDCLSITTTATYGPTLEKGISPLKPHQNPFLNSTLKPSQNPQDEEGLAPFDEGQFTRVYNVSAIRVPAEKCFEIENRIRGHLLNWPRVSNIARVPGDEVDSGVVDLIRGSEGGELGEGGVKKAASRRIYGMAEGDGEELSGVLYRDKLAKEFNAKGFVNFRNLAKISRPTKRKKKKKKKKGEGEEGGGADGGKGTGSSRRRRSVVVEVVAEGNNVGDGDDLSDLLGEDFEGRNWRGSTRLLLLDEKYASRNIDELPEAVKVINF